MADYIDINKDIINLILNNKEKCFILVGENSSGKTEILKELENKGLKTIDNFRFFDKNAIKLIEDTIEKEEKIVITTHDISQIFNCLCIPYTSIIIATFFDDLYDLASFGDLDEYSIYNLTKRKENKLEHLLKKLLSIAIFDNWTTLSEEYFNTIKENKLTPSQKTIYKIILKNKKKSL